LVFIYPQNDCVYDYPLINHSKTVMSTEINQEEVVIPESNEGEGESGAETISISKTEWAKTHETLGNLKREIKDLKKPKDEPKQDTPIPNQKPDDALLQRMERLAFKTANINHEDDIELARKTAQKWGMDVEEVLEDEDFQVKLKKQQDSRTNIEATSGVRGDGSGKANSKSKSDFWINSNTPPSDDDVANYKIPRSELSKIMGHFVKNKGSNKVFYND
jgi:hypothetical protein